MPYRKERRVTRIPALVTGGAEFLGSHLADRLLADSYEVIGVNNLFTGSKANIAHLRDHSDLEFVRHDVTFPVYLEVDLVFNLACPASPPGTRSIRSKL